MTLLEPQVGVFCILQARWVGKIAQGCKNLTNILAAIIYPNEELSSEGIYISYYSNASYEFRTAMGQSR